MSDLENLPMPLLPMCDDGRKSDEIDAAIFGMADCGMYEIHDIEALMEFALLNGAEA
jgi:hypothetical protein